MSTTH